MPTSTALKRFILLALSMVTLGWLFLLGDGGHYGLLAAESPLPQPWPTLVVDYPPALPEVAAPANQASAVRVSWLFRSPLRLPTLPPDALAPSTTLTVTGELGQDGWLRSPATITVVITDNVGAGVSEVRLAGVAEWTEREYYYPPLVVREEGSHTLKYRSLDMAHNVEAVQSRPLRIDRTPPQPVPPVLDGNQLANGWYNSPVTLKLSAEDALSGLAGLERRDAAGDWQATAAVTPLSQTGQHALVWRAVDRAGNPSAEQEVLILLDLTPPTTTHTLTPTAAGDWFNLPVSVTLTAVDEGAGVFATQFRLNHESSWHSYAAPILLNEDGRYTLAYYSSDRALNLETPHTVQIALDRTPPVLTYTVNGVYPPPTWVRSSATLVVTATDALAGVTQVEAAHAGGDWQAYTTPLLVTTPGQHQIDLQARDAAGNRVATTAKLAIDATPPQSTLLLDGGRGPNSWFVTPVTMTLSAVDSESGVAERQFRLNGGAWQTYTQPVVLTSQPVIQLEYLALDQVGNQEAANLARFNLDLGDPTAHALVRYGESSPTGWYISPVTLALQGTDDESGLQQIDYRLDHGDWQPYTGEFSLDQGGQHRIDYRAVDRGGRLGATQAITAWIDLTAPLIQTDFAAQLANGEVDLSDYVMALDSESGVQTMTLLLNDAPYQPGRRLSPGAYTLQVAAVNRAGLRAEQVHRFVIGGVTYLPLIVQSQ